MNEMGYWFISHCSKDIKIVEQIVDVLKDRGIAYWKAPEMIPVGSNYAKEIPKAIKNSSIFLFIVSEAAQSSVWIEKELDSAINARKKIVPVRIDDTPLSDMYLFYMNNIQMIDIQIEANGIIAKDSLKKLHRKFEESMPVQISKPMAISEVTEETPKPIVISKSTAESPKPMVISETIEKNINARSSIEVTEHKDTIEKTSIQNEMERRRIDNRTNAFRINKIPVFCDKCGMKLEYEDVGTYKCPACNIIYYDDFRKIKNYISDNGPAPAYMIARSTGVSKQAIDYYFNDGAEEGSEKKEFVPTMAGRPMDKYSTSMWRSNLWKK